MRRFALRVRELSLRTQPASFREAIDQTEELNRGTDHALTPSDRAALWLAALITQAVAAATLIPIYLLARRTTIRVPSPGWRPRSGRWCRHSPSFCRNPTRCYPCSARSFFGSGSKAFGTGAWRLCFLAGAALWLTMFVSLAVLPIGAAAFLLTLWEGGAVARRPNGPCSAFATGPRGSARRVVGWAIPVGLLALAGVNLLRVWSWNYHNHAGFYQQNVRTYGRWLVANPIELAFALGRAAARWPRSWASDFRFARAGDSARPARPGA